MAQAATMGPPLSPREIRRSGRRSAPSATSKSPDSDLPPRQKESTHRPSQSSAAANRGKRTKEEPEDHNDDRKPPASATLSTASNSSSATTKGKRKNKDKDREKQRLSIEAATDPIQDPQDSKVTDPVEEEEQGITRCVCGSNGLSLPSDSLIAPLIPPAGEDETDAGEFMVQCETCKVWQHGLCMGYESEDQVHDADYYCEQCRPDLHSELFKRLAKKARQSSAVSHGAAASRVSRSHSPTHLLKQPSKRRNTMNSRDANFDESLKEIIEATAAEAAAAQENAAQQQQPPHGPKPDPEDEPEVGSHNRKKRKRTDDDVTSKKRTRSASSASDQQPPSNPRPPSPPPKFNAPPVPRKIANAGKRLGRRAAPAPSVTDAPAPHDGDDSTQPATTTSTTTTTTTTTKRQGGNSRAKGSGTAKRPPISHSNSHGNSNMSHESVSRRGQSNTTGQGNSALESTRAYRNSHAYAVSQQPLFTSWGLPDYLAHLEEMLPTNVPQPLEIQSGSGTAGGRGESMERTMERGVKVKWPSKRTSVGDMNKRVRALVEWVGREQANALDRERRREALEKALKQEAETSGKDSGGADDDAAMAVDGSLQNQTTGQSKSAAADSEQDSLTAPAMIRADSTSTNTLWKSDDGKPMSTMKMMEELMEELIGFQERFGPGAAKTRERERRSMVTS